MKRYYSIDFIKFFAIVFVVIIHTDPFNNIVVLGLKGSYIDFVLDTFARFAVPFFFVVAGYLFSQKLKESDTQFVYFKRYIFKVTRIYIYWQTFYLVNDVMLNIIRSYVTGLNIKIELLHYLSSINIFRMLYYSEGSSGHQLWYLGSLLLSISVLFLFNRLNKVSLLLVISFALHIVGLFGQSYSGFLDLSIQTRDALFFGLFYTTLGFLFSENYNYFRWIMKKKPKIYLYMFFIFSALQILERTILVKVFGGNMGDYFISTIFVTICLFLFVLNNSQLGKNSLFSKIGKNSVGIYVIHVFFLNSVNTFLIFFNVGFLSKTILWQLLFTPIVLVVSYKAYNLIQHLKKKLISYKKQNVRALDKKVTL